MLKYLSISLLSCTLLLTGCTDKENKKSLTEGGMKCGAGKCGSSMVDGSTLLVKKKMNILNQLEKKDTRRDCVLNAKSSKVLFNCVRDAKTGRLSIKNTNKFQDYEKKTSNINGKSAMKCETGKCGTNK